MHWRMNEHRSTQENTKNNAPITQGRYSKATRRKFRIMKKTWFYVPAVTHHNEGLHRQPRMLQCKTQVQRSTQQKQAVQKNLMEKKLCKHHWKDAPWNTQSAHQNPQRKNSLKNKQTNESEAKQHTPNQPKQRTSRKQHRIPGLVLHISCKN